MNTHFTLAGKQVRCGHCEHPEFDAREVLLNTRAATFFGFDWANRGATVLACRRCTHLEWFNLSLEEMLRGEPDKAPPIDPR